MTIPILSSQHSVTATTSERTYLEAMGAPEAGLSRETVQQLVDAAITIDRSLTTCGLRFSVCEDMDSYTRVVESVGKFVPTVFDRRIKPTPRRGEVLGLIARDGQGRPIGTVAVRLCRLQRTLADHLSTLSLFYANPLEQMEGGEYLVIKGEARRYAEAIEERGVWIGCFWVSPDYRGERSNLSRFLPLAGRVLATMRWGCNVFFSLTEVWLRKQHARDRIGNPDIYEAVEWYRPQLPEPDRLRRSEILLMAYEHDAMVLQARQLVAGEGEQLWIRSRPQDDARAAAAG